MKKFTFGLIVLLGLAFANPSEGIEFAEPRLLLQSVSNYQDPCIVDFNGDGYLDIVVTQDLNIDHRRQPIITLLLNDGDGNFEEVRIDNHLTNTGCNFQVGDINQDGVMDFAIFSLPELGIIRVSALLGIGNNQYEAHTTDIEYWCDGVFYTNIQIIDFDEDGLNDIVLSIVGSATMVFYQRDNDGFELEFSPLSEHHYYCDIVHLPIIDGYNLPLTLAFNDNRLQTFQHEENDEYFNIYYQERMSNGGPRLLQLRSDNGFKLIAFPFSHKLIPAQPAHSRTGSGLTFVDLTEQGEVSSWISFRDVELPHPIYYLVVGDFAGDGKDEFISIGYIPTNNESNPDVIVWRDLEDSWTSETLLTRRDVLEDWRVFNYFVLDKLVSGDFNNDGLADLLVISVNEAGEWDFDLHLLQNVSLSVLEPDRFNPIDFVLHPLHPNPFNSSTQIRFDLPTASEVKLSVFDINGRLLTNLVNGTVSAGSHAVTWDASGFATGVYFVKMETSNFTETRKVVLMK